MSRPAARTSAPIWPPALVRATVVSGSRRTDLALPGSVPVAELVPELARRVGLLDGLTAHGGHRVLTIDGQELVGETGLLAQGVRDGAVLVVSSALPAHPPRVYDDVVEAMADAVERDVRRWSPDEGGRAGVAAAAVLMALGVVALLRATTDRASTFTSLVCAGAAAVALGLVCLVGLPDVRRFALAPLGAGTTVGAAAAVAHGTGVDPAVVLTTALTLLVVADGLLPRLALAVTGTDVTVLLAHADIAAAPPRVDPARVRADVRRAHDVLVAVSAALGVLLVLVAPLAVSLGLCGSLLAVGCCLALVLRTRAFVSAQVVLTGAASGLLGLASTAGSVIWMHPEWHGLTAASLLVGGAVLLAVTVVPLRASLWPGRLGDLAETACVVALLPLLVVATGLFSAVRAG